MSEPAVEKTERTALLEERLNNYRRAVNALQESESRFRTLADTAPVMIWMSSSGKLCNYFNRVWLDFTGRSAQEEMGDGWTEGVHPADLYRCLNTALTAIDARRDFTLEYRLRRFDGEYRWVLDTGVPRFTPDGSFAGYVGSCIDITAGKQAEEALRASNARNRALLAAIPDLILRIKNDGTLMEFVSSSGKGLLSPRKQALGKNIVNVLPSDVARLTMRHARLALQNQQPQTYEFTLPLRGEVHAFEARLVFSGIDEVLAIVRDISELKRTEQTLRHFADRLATAQEDERRRISRELHDETGQNLTAIIVRLHMLERQLSSWESAPAGALKELNELCELAQSTQLRLRSLAHVLHPSVLEHLGLAEALRSFIRGLRAGSQVRLSVYIPRDFPRFSLTTESTIYRIVQEAVMNAFRHARANSISLRCTAGEGMAFFAIKDNGRGFGAKRVDAPGSVGLISMRERAEMIGAKLDITTVNRQGTLVTLCFPLQPTEEANETLALLRQK